MIEIYQRRNGRIHHLESSKITEYGFIMFKKDKEEREYPVLPCFLREEIPNKFLCIGGENRKTDNPAEIFSKKVDKQSSFPYNNYR